MRKDKKFTPHPIFSVKKEKESFVPHPIFKEGRYKWATKMKPCPTSQA